MKRQNPLEAISSRDDQVFLKQIIFHEVGHAAAICLYNNPKQLPPVYFQININQLSQSFNHPLVSSRTSMDHFAAVIDGGYLSDILPSELLEDKHCRNHVAIEADIINLLAGPLAEAKYIALRDNESFTRNLVNMDSLQFYGGQSDIEKVYEFLEDFSLNNESRDDLIIYLFDKAFQFINMSKNWEAIERLANYIINNNINKLSYEEAMTVLEVSAQSELI
jgi:hypothetical protein